MQIHNKRIITFFSQHPALDPETTILSFVDIMENLHQNMNKSMNHSMITDILGRLTQIEKNQQQLSKDTHNHLTIKMSEFKKEYISELKMLLTCNVTDKIAPLIREQNDSLFSKTTSMIQTVIPKNEAALSNNMEKLISQLQHKVNQDTKQFLSTTIDKASFDKYVRDLDHKLSVTVRSMQSIVSQTVESSEKRLDSKMDSVREISTVSGKTTQILENSVGNLLKKFENSSIKGKMSENLIQNIIHDLYPTANIESVANTKETGDIMMRRAHKPTILIENKLWNRSVVQSEVSKFIRDIEKQNCCGVFLSQNNKITTKNNFEINIHNGNVLIYLHHVNNDPDKIKMAIDIVDYFKAKLDDFSDDSVDAIENISKETLEYINLEFQQFITAKSTLIKITKDFNKKLLRQIDELKLPSLEDYLAKKYSFSSNKFVCEYCGFVGKNQQSKSAHLRGCFKKKQHDAQKAQQVVVCNT